MAQLAVAARRLAILHLQAGTTVSQLKMRGLMYWHPVSPLLVPPHSTQALAMHIPPS